MWVYRVGHAIFLFAFMLSYLWVSHQPLAQINALTLAAVLPLPQATTLTIDGALSNIRPFYIASGYGLFRMMTGVGIGPSASVGIGGVPPPVVARPEIVLEGSEHLVL